MAPSGGWAHSCCSATALAAALSDPSVHSIESDIVVSSLTGEPVMAHPPATHSDLSFEKFLVSCTGGTATTGAVSNNRAALFKNLKFDFKHMGAVEPCLQRTARERERLRSSRQTVWLNADVLAGPGCHPGAVEPGHRTPPAILPDEFLRLCGKLYPEGVLSLGWKVDVVGRGGYSDAHCEAMHTLLARHGLLDTAVVFAVAARQTAQNPEPLRKLLRRLPRSELLVWTGTGEPPILPGLVDQIRRSFTEHDDEEEMRGRINFDVAVQKGGPLRAALWNGDRSIFLFRAYRPLKWALAESGSTKKKLLFSLLPRILVATVVWFIVTRQA